MHVLIMGAGAIGMSFACLLEAAGHDVTLLGRPETAQAAAQDGLLVLDEKGEHRLRAKVFTEIGALSTAPDFVVLTVKAFDTGPAALQLAPLAKDNIPLLLVQNGVGGELAGLEALPEAPWFGGVTTLVADRLGPGYVRQTLHKAGLVIAPMTQVKDVSTVLAPFRGTDFTQVRLCSSYSALKWSKLLLNILANAVPAITDMSPAQTMADPRLFAVERAAYREARAVIRAQELRPIALPGYPVPALAWAISQLPAALVRPILVRRIMGDRAGKLPSLHQDLRAGRLKSEVLYLNGAVVQCGDRLGVSVPVNRALTETVLSIARCDEPWERYRGKPAALVARCAGDG